MTKPPRVRGAPLPHMSMAVPGLSESRAPSFAVVAYSQSRVDSFAAPLPDDILCVYLHNDEVFVPIKSIYLQNTSLQSNRSKLKALHLIY